MDVASARSRDEGRNEHQFQGRGADPLLQQENEERRDGGHWRHEKRATRSGSRRPAGGREGRGSEGETAHAPVPARRALALAVAVVVVILVATGGGGDDGPTKRAGESVAGANDTATLLAGIEQKAPNSASREPGDADRVRRPAVPLLQGRLDQILPQVIENYRQETAESS